MLPASQDGSNRWTMQSATRASKRLGLGVGLCDEDIGGLASGLDLTNPYRKRRRLSVNHPRGRDEPARRRTSARALRPRCRA
jgi:hypothetical protein